MARTKGPLFVGSQNDALFVIDQPPRPSNDDVNPDRQATPLAQVYFVDGDPQGGNDNARLFAAAPDLLAACERSLSLLRSRLDFAEILDDEKRHIDALCAAISKAKEGK